MPDYVAKLNKEIDKRIDQKLLKIRSSGLAQSSIEDGSLPEYDVDGNLMSQIGLQYDDTHAPVTYSGPTPPVPAGIGVVGGPTSIKVAWDGTFVDALVAPLDWTAFEVHASDSADFVPDPLPDSATRVGIIGQAAGGSLTFQPATGSVYVRCVTRTAAGKYSDPTDAVDAYATSTGAQINNSDGSGSFASITSHGDITVDGKPLLGTLYDPASEPGVLDGLSRGVRAYTLRNLPAINATINQSTNGPLAQIDVILPPGRDIELRMPWRVNPAVQSGTSPAELLYGVRAFWQFTSDGTEPPTPGTSQPELLADSSCRTAAVGAAAGVSGVLSAEISTLPSQYTSRVKILFIVFTSAGTQLTPSLFSPFDWVAYLSDRGPAALLLDAAVPGSGSQQQFTTTWTATDSRTWGSTGATYGAANADLMYHGVSAAAGLTHAAVVFNGSATSGDETGKTMQAALTGATILKVEVGVQSVQWKDGTGELNLQKFSGSTLSTNDSTTAAGTQVRKAYTARSQWQWTTDPAMTSWVGPTNRGIYLGPPTWQGSSTYGAFASAYYSNTLLRPQLRITYARSS